MLRTLWYVYSCCACVPVTLPTRALERVQLVGARAVDTRTRRTFVGLSLTFVADIAGGTRAFVMALTSRYTRRRTAIAAILTLAGNGGQLEALLQTGATLVRRRYLSTNQRYFLLVCMCHLIRP